MHIETTAKKWREKLFLGCENVCYWAASGHLYRALSQNLSNFLIDQIVSDEI